MKKNSIIAMALAALLCTASLSACNSNKSNINDITKNNTETQNPAGNPGETGQDNGEDADVILGLSAYDWKYDEDEVMFTIGGYPITFGEYRYYAMGYKPQADGGDESYWTDETEAEFKSTLIDQFKQFAGIRLLATTAHGAELTDEDYAVIDGEIDLYKLQFGEEFNTVLDQSYVTEETFRHMLEYDLFTEKLLYANAPEEEVANYAADNYVEAQHILVDTEEKANEILLSLKNDEISFEDAAKEYSSCSSAQSGGNLGAFTKGQMVPEFENAVFAMQVGEISNPVKSEFGYHIIKKLPLELKPDSDEYRQIVYEIAGERATNELQSYVETIEVETTQAFDELTMKNIGTLKTAK